MNLTSTFALYCYEESKPNDDKDDYHIDRVEKYKNDKWPLKQFIKPFTPKFKDVSGYA